MSHRPRRSRRRQNQEAVELEVYDGMPDPLAPSTAVTADSFASTSQRRLDQDQVHDQGPPLPSLRSVLLERFGTRPPPNSHHSNDDELPPLQALRLSSSSSSREDGVAVAHPPLQVPSRRRSQSQSQSLPPQSDVTVHPPSRRFVPPVYSPLPRFNFRPTSPRSSGHVSPSSTQDAGYTLVQDLLQVGSATSTTDGPVAPSDNNNNNNNDSPHRLRRRMQHFFLPDPPSESTLPVLPSSSMAPLQEDDRVPAASIPLEPRPGASTTTAPRLSSDPTTESEEGSEDEDDDDDEEEYFDSDDSDQVPPLIEAPPESPPPPPGLQHQSGPNRVNPRRLPSMPSRRPLIPLSPISGCTNLDDDDDDVDVDDDLVHEDMYNAAGQRAERRGDRACCGQQSELDDEEVKQQIRWELDLIQGRVDKDGDPIPPELQKASPLQSDEVSEILAQHLTRRLFHCHHHRHHHQCPASRPPHKRLPTAIR